MSRRPPPPTLAAPALAAPAPLSPEAMTLAVLSRTYHAIQAKVPIEQVYETLAFLELEMIALRQMDAKRHAT